MKVILFVDDEPVTTEALRMVVEAKGFHCDCCTNMTQAMSYFGENEVSVLVSDIMMPAGEDFPEVDSAETGFRLVEKVRELYPDTGVICLSVIGDQEKIEHLKKQGVLYLRKGETPLSTAARLIESKATGVTSFE